MRVNSQKPGRIRNRGLSGPKTLRLKRPWRNFRKGDEIRPPAAMAQVLISDEIAEEVTETTGKKRGRKTKDQVTETTGEEGGDADTDSDE